MTLVQAPPSPPGLGSSLPPTNRKVLTLEHKTTALHGVEKTLWGFQKASSSQGSPVVSHPCSAGGAGARGSGRSRMQGTFR